MMHISMRKTICSVLLVIVVLLLSSCAAGDPRFAPESPAGFWQGLWHGMISVITFIINLFNHDVKVYEPDNNGGWYNFGFLLGVICIWGGGSGAGWRIRRRKREEDWEELSEKVGSKVMQKLKEWAETEDKEEWEEIGKKIEEKIKRKIREWVEEE